MAADAGIFSQYMQPVRSVADYTGDMDKQEQNALTLAASRMKGQQDQQTMQDSQTARQLAQGYGGDMNALSQAYMKAGLIPQAQALQKSMLESDKSKADVSKVRAEALDKQLGALRSFVPQINSPEAAGQYAAAMYDHPELGKLASQFGTRDDVIKRNMEAFAKDPRSWMVNSAGVTADKLLSSLEGKRQNINAGGSSIGQTTNYYGEVVPGQTTVTPITQSADNAATVGASRANNLASVAATDRATQGRITAAGVAATQQTAPKPMPAAALKMVQEDLDAIGTASSINADLEAIKTQISSGTLKFGPVGNLANRALNASGMSTEESRNFGSFQTTMERLRNDSLRLNKGVQTDGDAQRAWNELFANINDTKLVEQRLGEIQRLDERAVQLRKLDIDNVRGNYGHGPMDVSAYEKQPATLNGGKPLPQAKPGAVARVTNNEDYAKLPSGTTYQTPDGKTRRKP